jgi:hypothetical protein
MKAKNAEELLKGIDFPLLKEQKKALLKLIEDIDNVPVLEKLEGVVSLINEVQDLAVDVYGMEENEVFDLHPDDEDDSTTTDGECTDGLKISKPYFEIVSSGYNEGLEREEIQVHCGENGNLMIIKTPEGFIVDVYNQMENIDSLTVWEDDLSPLEITIDPVLHVDRIAEFLIKNGQKHSEITANLNLRPSHADSDEILMEDYFYLEGHKKWYPKNSSMYGNFEQAIANYLRDNRDNY